MPFFHEVTLILIGSLLYIRKFNIGGPLGLTGPDSIGGTLFDNSQKIFRSFSGFFCACDSNKAEYYPSGKP